MNATQTDGLLDLEALSYSVRPPWLDDFNDSTQSGSATKAYGYSVVQEGLSR